MARLNDIYCGDKVTLTHIEGTWTVTFVNFINVWIEVCNEDDTVCHIVAPIHIVTHTPRLR